MTKQDRQDLQSLINDAQNEIDKVVSTVQEMIDDTDDDEEREALMGLLDELDTQLPSVGDYFPEDKKP
jgi:hypothetical protein